MAKHGGCDRGVRGGRGEPSADCPECVAQIAAAVIHKIDCRGAFGRRDLECGRCRALAAGVPAARTYRTLGRYA
jgi:uncharacterized protein (DUF1499 family)